MSADSELSFYSSGELATLCGVSVRTVQYYDRKGLLAPSATSRGGRRQYTDDDAKKLQSILVLKSCGLTLATIRKVFDDDASDVALRELLAEQKRQLVDDIEEKRESINRIDFLMKNMNAQGVLPADSLADIEAIMTTEKTLKVALMRMIAVGVVAEIIEIAAIVYGFMTKQWIGPVLVLVFIFLPLTAYGVKIYREATAYVCPHCHEVFVPEFTGWFFAFHTPKTRKLRCTQCGEKDWCVEVARERHSTRE